MVEPQPSKLAMPVRSRSPALRTDRLICGLPSSVRTPVLPWPLLVARLRHGSNAAANSVSLAAAAAPCFVGQGKYGLGPTSKPPADAPRICDTVVRCAFGSCTNGVGRPVRPWITGSGPQPLSEARPCAGRATCRRPRRRSRGPTVRRGWASRSAAGHPPFNGQDGAPVDERRPRKQRERWTRHLERCSTAVSHSDSAAVTRSPSASSSPERL